jgi:hypothetical protein
MPDERDVLEVLKSELEFIEKGGYGRSPREPRIPTSAFQDSLSCLNYADPKRPYPCESCLLMAFVGKEHEADSVPCHFIPLNEAGETIDLLERRGDQAKLEEELKKWLRAAINRIEDQRPAT